MNLLVKKVAVVNLKTFDRLFSSPLTKL